MTREQFLSQYTGEWSPSDGHWFGLDFGWRGQEYRFQTDSMYHPQIQYCLTGVKRDLACTKKKVRRMR